MRVATNLTALTLVAGAALAGVQTAPPASAASSHPAHSATEAPPRSRSYTVTLLTGDRVTLASPDALTGAVRPARGREHVRFVASREAGRLYVVPRDAQRLVETGRLDRRLFDVTTLIRDGYHDAARDSLPLIVTYRPGGAATAGTRLLGAGARVTRDLPAIDGAAVSAAKNRAPGFWAALTAPAAGVPGATAGLAGEIANGIDQLWLDGVRHTTLDHSVPQIGAPAAYRAGYTGRGVTVAVLDTGVDAGHPDLAGKVREARNFSAEPDARDTVGHGTHVASIIAGSGAASGGRYRGVAPDARIFSGKVCEAMGCTESAILAGMQWAAVDKRATAVNLSLGGEDGPEIDPLERAIDTLTRRTGTLFVVAAGNSGSDGSVGSPGSADAALTVGAVDPTDELAPFSSRGPRVGDGAIKPDLTAPGVDIVAARADGTELGTPVGTRYVALSGTSMATPHVVGAVALLAQQHPSWLAGQFKSTLMASARAHPGLTAYQQGAGRVDVARAITQTVTTDPTAISYGRAGWPHGDDPAMVRTVTYRNAGPAQATLRLVVLPVGPGLAPAPGGMFQLGAGQVTVPAGGEAAVTVTVDTSRPAPDGYWSGRLVAIGGPVEVTTPLGVYKEVESYDLTLAQRDRTGAPTDRYSSALLGLDSALVARPYDADGTVTLRLPRGRYGLASVIDTPRASGWYDSALISQPEFVLASDSTVVLDGRTAKPVRVSVPEWSAVPALVDVGVRHFIAAGAFGLDLLGQDPDGLFTAGRGATVPAARYVSVIGSQWALPGADGRFDGSPYLYALSEAVPGRLPTGYVRRYTRRDLAAVRQQFAGGAPGQQADRYVMPLHRPDLGGWAVALTTSVPGERTEYYSTAAGVRWTAELDLGVRDADGWLKAYAVLVSSPRGYPAGRTETQRWNDAPFGPALPPTQFPGDWVTRFGDTVLVDIPLFSDRTGHAGFALADSGRTALYRDGTLVGATAEAGWGSFPVPRDAAGYRLEVAATRGTSDLATGVSAVWTFRSARPAVDGFAPLPVLAVRFAPRLDVTDAAPGAGSFEIPVTVARQPGAPAATVRSLLVEASYDDGRTWVAAGLRRSGPAGGWLATVRHPAGPGYVALRARAGDSSGNTLTQTVLHAYRIR